MHRSRSSCRGCAILALTVPGLLLLQRPGLAQTAEALLEAGVARYAKADFPGSLALLERAHLVATRPRLLAQIHLYIGANNAVLHREERAREAFVTALTHDPTLALPPDRFNARTEKLFRVTRDALRGTLLVRADRPSAIVAIDGEDLGPAPVERVLPIGARRLEVRTSDRRLYYAAEVVVIPDRTTTVYARLRAPPPTRSQRAIPARPRAATLPDEPRGRSRLWTWITAGAAVAAGGVALGFGVSARSDYSTWESADDGDERLSLLQSRVEDKAAVANALFITAGVLAATSMVFFFLEGREPRGTRRARLRGGPGTLDLVAAF